MRSWNSLNFFHTCPIFIALNQSVTIGQKATHQFALSIYHKKMLSHNKHNHKRKNNNITHQGNKGILTPNFEYKKDDFSFYKIVLK